MKTTDMITKIEAMETEAGEAGDLIQAAICQIALYGAPTEKTLAALDNSERKSLFCAQDLRKNHPLSRSRGEAVNDLLKRAESLGNWEAYPMQVRETLRQLLEENARLMAALNESLRLQTHYAELKARKGAADQEVKP